MLARFTPTGLGRFTPTGLARFTPTEFTMRSEEKRSCMTASMFMELMRRKERRYQDVE